MSWHYLQEQEAAFWGGSSLDGAPSALLKLIPIAEASYSQDNATECSNRFQFGTTYEHSTESFGAEKSTLSVADSHVSPIHAGEKNLEMTMNEHCGRTLSELPKKQDCQHYSLKTSLNLYQEDTQSNFLINWKKLVTRFKTRSSARLQALGLLNIGSVYGYWPTPTATDWHGYKCRDRGKRNVRLNHFCYLIGRPDLAHDAQFREALMGWPIGWTDLEPLETARFRQWYDSHGPSYQ